ncbi:hypothetical protein HYX12_00250, partial [Candidatus Woesearchaeota archaeon]|nr:hypothetical protein [Candidatus Woesearchaeota archaeon]
MERLITVSCVIFTAVLLTSCGGNMEQSDKTLKIAEFETNLGSFKVEL